MKPDKLSDNWLFQQHSKHTITIWVEKLKYFSFTRAWSVYANDGDAFRVEFFYSDKQDLIDKITQLGLILNTITVEFPVHPPEATGLLPKQQSVINRFKYFAQPGRTIIFGHKVFVWISDSTISIVVAGNKDDNFLAVTEEDFRACLDLEKHFDKLNWINAVDKKNEQHIYCISREKYPELFTQRN